MFPSDFASGRPRVFALAAEWTALRDRYGVLGPSPQLEWVFQHVQSCGATDVLLEHEYLDRDYRDEYRQFYATTFRPLPDRCERLHFWAGRQYLGYCSVRPLAGRPVGRTMLDPGPAFQDDVSCVIRASATPYGMPLVVPAFPFMSQDSQYARCAHAVIWMIARYHHLRYSCPQRFMSDIVAAASSTETERIVPSTGLVDDQVGATFRSLGLDAVQYALTDLDGNALTTKDDVHGIVRRYLNSGIPLALGTPGHLTALIGGGYEDGELTVIQCDDEQGAYQRRRIQLSGNDQWELLWVPLPGRIYLTYEAIADLAVEQVQSLAADHGVTAILDSRPLRYREYVVEVQKYKAQLRGRNLPGGAANAHAQIPSARWLWILEVQDADLAMQTADCVLGELAIDATSDERHPGFLFTNLPGLRASWPEQGASPNVIHEDVGSFAPYRTGTILNL